MQVLTLKIAGLHTSPNSYSEVPDGALLEATNIAINQASVAEPRRGYDVLGASLSGTPNSMTFYKNTLHIQVGAADLRYYNAGSWTQISGTYTPPTGVRTKFAESNQNLYFTSASGVYKISAAGGTASLAGVPKAVDLTGTQFDIASGFINASGKTVAYRVVWGIRDANSNLILGVPSQRVEVTTSGAPASGAYRIDLTVYIPAGITTSHFYQVYRSKTENSGTTPSDELQLVYEGAPTSGEISAGSLTVQDITSESLRGATIYTAQSQEGLAAGNERPPLCTDIAVFKGTTFYANTTSRHRLTVTLLGVGLGTNSTVDDGDTVTIAGTTFTWRNSPSLTNDVGVPSSGTASTKIRDASLNLIRKINANSSTVYAYYLSSGTDLPGKILLEARSLGASSFAMSASAGNATAWNGLGTSSADAFKNGLYYSKVLQPEAVPLTNFFQVGSKDKSILRIVPLQDTLFVLKEDGIFRVSESGSGFSVQPFDFSAKLLAVESPAVLNNLIYALTDQGVVTISDGGVSVISRPIEQNILRSLSNALATVKTESFGVGYEQDRKYLLFLPENQGDTSPTAAYVYDTFTSSWVRWALARRCGAVGNVDVRDSTVKDLLYLGQASTDQVWVERKALNFTDHVDFYGTLTIASVSGLTVTLTTGGDGIEVGDVLYQSATVWANVVSKSGDVMTMNIQGGFSAGSVTVLKPVSTRIAWAPQPFQNPGTLKQTSEVSLIFRSQFVGNANAGFYSDLSVGEQKIAITGATNSGWGLFQWSNDAIWGGIIPRRPNRVWVPLDKQVGSFCGVTFEHKWGFSKWELEGVSLFGETVGSPRVGK